jgi:hypothetical protein
VEAALVKKSFTIRDLPASERPRERLQKLGVEKKPYQFQKSWQ